MKHAIVVDLGYGDAGKGSTVDWLCSPGRAERSRAASRIRAVVRFNGGAQAGHNVVTPDGRHHTFAQFGAGTFHGVPTHLSRFMLVEPFALAAEAAHLAELGIGNPFALLSADSRALITTPYHRAANRVRESARDRTPGSARHGTCGMGIGETVSFSLAVSPDKPPRVGDCRDRADAGQEADSATRPHRGRSGAVRVAAARRPAEPGVLRGRLPGVRAAGADRGRGVRRIPRRAPGLRALRLRGRAGRPAGRVVRLPPAHDVVDDHLRQRRARC